MEQTPINWSKQALNFIAGLGLADRYETATSILLQGLHLLQESSGCDEAFLVKREDSVTSRIFKPGPADQEVSYIDPSLLAPLEHRETSYLQMSDAQTNPSVLKLFRKPASLIFLPLHQNDVNCCFLLSWQSPFHFSADFKEFIAACLNRIHEKITLASTYYNLEELKVRFNSILQTVPESIVFIDDSGKNSWVNEQAAKLFHIAGGNVEPALLADAMQKLRASASNKEEIFKRGMELFQSKDKKIKDWQWIFNEPEFMVLNVCCTPTVSEHISGMLWTFGDCSNQYLFDQHLRELNVQLEEKSRLADEQNKAKSEFLANMSHEIRTPMNGVIGMTSLLRNTTLTEDQFDFVESIRISADALLEIINEILDFSKIESGKLELEEHPFFIHKIIEETYDLLAFKAHEKDLDLLYSIDPGVPLEVIGDMTRLRQIVVNLVGNAIKFTDTGEILTSIHLASKNTDHYELEFSVKDSGIGIPQDKLHKLFNSFSQVDSSTTRKYGGTGLGLAISSRLVDKMNGRIWVESEVNVGTTFKFTILIKANAQVKEYKAANAQKDLIGRSALLIDDNLTNLQILKGHCSRWGMHADTFADPMEGFAAMDQRGYDIIIIDMMMPKINGINLAKQIRQKHGNQIPMILFSSVGHFPASNKEDLKMFAAVLDKPIKPDYFYKTLQDKLSDQVPEKPVVVQPAVAQKPASKDQVSILIAEDNIINQKIVVNAFKNIGYSCDVVANGLEVLSSLERQSYNIVMMDVHMPEMDGLQATRKS
ncbi:MAG: ATP-binding protein [Bacteroidota bacterium]